MFLVIPYHVDVPMRQWPWMNWVLIGVTVLMYPLCMREEGFTSFGELRVLGEGPLGWFGHMLLHADLLHLFGNMLFLWVFGNAVCAKIGNLSYGLFTSDWGWSQVWCLT
jgi:membrane associated rhomboid family serine protease